MIYTTGAPGGQRCVATTGATTDEIAYPRFREEQEANAALIIHAVNTFDEARAALEEVVRVLSHIQDMGLADRLKYVPVSAYKEAYAKAKAVLAKMEDA